jgi:hypothetical protein
MRGDTALTVRETLLEAAGCPKWLTQLTPA